MEKANLSGANAIEANFSGINLNKAILNSLDATSANFSDATMSKSSARRGVFDSADLQNITAINTDFYKASFREARIHGADFSHSTLDGTFFHKTTNILKDDNNPSNKISAATFTGARLIGASFDEALLANSDFTSTVLTGANFRRTDLKLSDFNKADMSEVNAFNSYFTSASLTEVTGASADFRQSYSIKLILTKQLSRLHSAFYICSFLLSCNKVKMQFGILTHNGLHDSPSLLQNGYTIFWDFVFGLEGKKRSKHHALGFFIFWNGLPFG